jgi:glycosyltransferase involved in cell wall biosynthesis
MKILVIIPDLGMGGAERLHINLATEWIKNGHEVCFALLRKEGVLLESIAKEIQIKDLNSKRILQSLPKILKFLREYQPTHIVAAMWPLTIITSWAWAINGFRSKYFPVEHCEFNDIHLKSIGSNKLLVRISGIFLNLSSKIIFVSRGVLESFHRKSFIIRNKSAVILNGTKLPDQSLVENHSKQIKKNILALGRISKQKDFQTTLHAFALALETRKDMVLNIVGDGPELNDLKKTSESLGISSYVNFVGSVLDPSSYFLDADIFIHSSFYDGMPMVLIEALSFGLSIISTDTPHGPKEILSYGKFGDIVPIGDIKKIAKLILIRIEKPISRKHIFSRASEYSIEQTALNYIKIFEE